jgi:hypothetical protein
VYKINSLALSIENDVTINILLRLFDHVDKLHLYHTYTRSSVADNINGSIIVDAYFDNLTLYLYMTIGLPFKQIGIGVLI